MPESSQVKGIGCSSAECRTPPTRPFTQSPLHRNSYMLGAFCTEHNVQECLSHINQEVSSLGLSSLSELGGGSQLNIVAVLNCMHDLIQLHHRGLKTLENMEVEQLKASSRSDYLQLTTTHLKEQLELSKRENTGLLERERQLQLKTKSLQNCLKNEKEEVQKLQNIIASRASQYNHDMKRKEREFTKLKERLNQLLADKKERKQAIDVLNNIGRADGKRSLWKTEKTEAKHEGEMYKTLLSSYDTRQQELMLENAELRKVLQQMKIDMVSILSSRKTPLKSNKSEHNAAQVASEEEEEEVFDPSKENIELYCTNAREKLTNSIRLQWRRLKSHVEKLDSQVSLAQMDESYKNDSVPRETHEDEMNRLKLEVQQCRDFIQTQQQLLQQLSSPCDEEPLSLLNDGHMLQGKELLREEWKTLEEQRKIFERERGNFTEAAIRLSHERQAFEEDRATWIKHQFLSLSPFGESKKPLLSKSTSAFLITEMDERAQLAREKLIECHTDSASSTPRCAPLASPSTAELYRTFCLIPENGSKKPKKKPEDVEEPGSLCGRGAAQRKRWNDGEDLSIFSLTLEENSS